MRTSVSLTEELASYVDEVAASAGENNAEAIRETIGHAMNLDDRVDELEDTVDKQAATIAELETDVERLQNEKQLILEEREEKRELAEYVEHERTVQERKAEAGIVTRAKWWLTGMDRGEGISSP